MRNLIIALLLICAHLVSAQNSWQVDSSNVTFVIKNAGIPVDGSFSGLEAVVEFNPKKLSESRIIASVDAATVKSGIRIRDNHLRRSDYFAVDEYPRIVLTSERFEKNGNQYVGHFNLMMKGTAGHIKVPFTFTQSGNMAIFKGSFSIERLKYDIGDTSMLLDEVVDINLWVAVSK